MTDQEIQSLYRRLENIYQQNVSVIWSPTYWDTLRAGMNAGLVREDVYTTAGLNGLRRRKYVLVPRETANILEGNFGQAKKAS